jgi:hypothetical protein
MSSDLGALSFNSEQDARMKIRASRMKGKVLINSVVFFIKVVLKGWENRFDYLMLNKHDFFIEVLSCLFQRQDSIFF